jgi:hypothetical protein
MDLSDLPSWTSSWFNLDQMSSNKQLKYLAHGRPQSEFESHKHDNQVHKYAAAGMTKQSGH